MNRYTVELRGAAIQGNKLAGYAAVFGQMTEIRGAWEAIAPGAFDETLKADHDVVALRDHNPALLLGRTKSGTLRLSTDDNGLEFEVDLPDTEYARDIRELVGRGDLAGASFGFLPGKEDHGPGPDGRQLRTHTSVGRLVDVSVVSTPAYEGTSVSLRASDLVAPRWRAQSILARHRALGRDRDH